MWPDDSSLSFASLFNGRPMDVNIQGIIEGYMGEPDDAITRARRMADIESLENSRPPSPGNFNDPNSLKFKFDLMNLIVRSDIVRVQQNMDAPEHTTFGSLTRESLRKEIVINYRDTARSSSLTLDPVLNMIPSHLHEEALSHAFGAFIDALTDVAREGPMAFVDKLDPEPKETAKYKAPKKENIDLDLDF